jgi:hypothetical protein
MKSIEFAYNHIRLNDNHIRLNDIGIVCMRTGMGWMMTEKKNVFISTESGCFH